MKNFFWSDGLNLEVNNSTEFSDMIKEYLLLVGQFPTNEILLSD